MTVYRENAISMFMDTDEKKIIPSPDLLTKYEQLFPGSAEKFFEEAHTEAVHRRNLELLRFQEEMNLSKRGQLLAFCLALVCLGVSFLVLYLGYDYGGLSALIVSIVSFAAVFIYVNKRK